MRRVVCLGMALLLGCRGREEPEAGPPEPPRGSPEWKIMNARTAAPADISGDATIMDWPAGDSAQPQQLAVGSNGWTCFPDDPRTPVDDPSCSDDVAMAWYDAFVHGRRPSIAEMGVAYLLQGGAAASHTDPAKLRPDSGQEWLVTPPFIAIVMPDPVRSFRGLPTTNAANGPWVMFAGTPYAHLMVPVSR